MFLGWGVLYAWAIGATIYKDHQDLVAYIPKAAHEQANSDQKVIDRQGHEIDKLKKLIPKFNPQCWMQNITLPAPKQPADAQSASEAVIVCNTELKAPITVDIFYDEQPSGFYFPIIVPNTEGKWGSAVLRNKSLSATLTQGSVSPYKAFVVAVDSTNSKPPVANKIQFR
ncbi:MAG: hypothetical protein ACYDCM_11075 [Candidatus Acidiferrales bacterium]